MTERNVRIIPDGATYTERRGAAGICGGSVLHVFGWSCAEAARRLPEIAAAGYSAIQLLPLQPPKDYRPEWNETGNNWWKNFQPLDFAITGNNNSYESWIGSADDLRSLCAEAKKYGVGVIVDVVFNHLANDGESGGTFSRLSADVAERFQNAKYFHSDPEGISDESRRFLTQRQMGMPDLNTADPDVQKWAAQLLIDYIKCGVTGFRFDAAKHIELDGEEDEYGRFGSDLWKRVLGGARDFYKRTGGEDELYMYGEIIGDAGTDIANYTKYMAVTDSNFSPADALIKNDASLLGDPSYAKNAPPSESVVWVESHDNFFGRESAAIPSRVIARAWAVVGARADSTALFFARPGDVLGEAGDDLTWKSPAVAEVNKFKNAFRGESEYVSFDRDQKTAFVVRGASGISIAKLDGAGKVKLRAHIGDGVYTDRVSGNEFTAKNGVISGKVGESGVAVVW